MKVVAIPGSYYRIDTKLFEPQYITRVLCGEECKGKCCKESIGIDLTKAAKVGKLLNNSGALFTNERYMDTNFIPSVVSTKTALGEHGCTFLDENGMCKLHELKLKPIYCTLFPLIVYSGVICFAYSSLLIEHSFNVFNECFKASNELVVPITEFKKELIVLLGKNTVKELFKNHGI